MSADSIPMSSHNDKSIGTSVLSTRKEPFQGWSEELLSAKDHWEDDYNFRIVVRKVGANTYQNDI
jgi:hypothetical protein